MSGPKLRAAHAYPFRGPSYAINPLAGKLAWALGLGHDGRIAMSAAAGAER